MPPSQPASLVFLGDVRVPIPGAARGGISPEPFAEVNDWLREADVVIANLEGPIGHGGGPRAGRGALLFNDPRVLDLAATWKQTLFVLANNHIMDFGPEGLARTLKALDRNQIPHVGAGLDEASAQQPCILNFHGRSIGVLAFTTEERHVGSVCAHGATPGCAEFRLTEAVAAVRSMVSRVDAVCVILHWGHERHAYPTPDQVAAVSELVRAGARVVVGHHPHVLQGLRVIGKSVAAYSLGNCYFPPFEQTNGRMSVQSTAEREFLLLKVRLEAGHRIRHELLGGRRGVNEQLYPYVNSERSRFESRLDQLSKPIEGGDYDGFYAGYARRRAIELHRQQILNSFKKIRMRDLQSIRLADLVRLWKRLTSGRQA